MEGLNCFVISYIISSSCQQANSTPFSPKMERQFFRGIKAKPGHALNLLADMITVMRDANWFVQVEYLYIQSNWTE